MEDRNKGSRLGYNSPDVVTPMHPQVNATAYGRLLERLKSQADTGRLAVGYISNGDFRPTPVIRAYFLDGRKLAQSGH